MAHYEQTARARREQEEIAKHKAAVRARRALYWWLAIAVVGTIVVLGSLIWRSIYVG